MFGTLVFSSILFISTQDAAFDVPRFVLSAVICREVLMLELSGMRECVRVDKNRRMAAEKGQGSKDLFQRHLSVFWKDFSKERLLNFKIWAPPGQIYTFKVPYMELHGGSTGKITNPLVLFTTFKFL